MQFVQEPAPALGPLSLVLQDTGRPPVDVSIEYLNGITGNFAVARVIGKGAFGDVHLGIDTFSNDFLAVKKMNSHLRGLAATPETLAAAHRTYEREITALTRFRHPHIVRLVGFSAPPSGERVLVYEYLPRGSLADVLKCDEKSAL